MVYTYTEKKVYDELVNVLILVVMDGVHILGVLCCNTKKTTS